MGQVEVDDRRTPDDELGAPVAAGRDATIYEAGPGWVLRRCRPDRDLRPESAAMQHARSHGYPVPQVRRVGPGEQVLERVEGPTMLDDLAAHPWRARRHGRTLAELHRTLHRIDAPPEVLDHPLGGRRMLVHLDLHPANVILGPTGPVVIDWSNVRAGRAEVDVAATWILLAAAERDGPAEGAPLTKRVGDAVVRRIEPLVRRQLLETFLDEVDDRAAVQAVLAPVAAAKLEDPNLRTRERAAIATRFQTP